MGSSQQSNLQQSRPLLSLQVCPHCTQRFVLAPSQAIELEEAHYSKRLDDLFQRAQGRDSWTSDATYVSVNQYVTHYQECSQYVHADQHGADMVPDSGCTGVHYLARLVSQYKAKQEQTVKSSATSIALVDELQMLSLLCLIVRPRMVQHGSDETIDLSSGSTSSPWFQSYKAHWQSFFPGLFSSTLSNPSSLQTSEEESTPRQEPLPSNQSSIEQQRTLSFFERYRLIHPTHFTEDLLSLADELFPHFCRFKQMKNHFFNFNNSGSTPSSSSSSSSSKSNAVSTISRQHLETLWFMAQSIEARMGHPCYTGMGKSSFFLLQQQWMQCDLLYKSLVFPLIINVLIPDIAEIVYEYL